jgi:predicted nucleic acid-binding protein
LSVPLVFEYEDALIRSLDATGLQREDVDTVLDYLCGVAHLQKVFYLWRPHLPDPKDDMVLELAVAARCQTIVTFNLRDFAGTDQFGISVARPGDFLSSIGAVR